LPRPAKTDFEHRLHSTVSQVGRSKPTQSPSVYAGGRPRIPQHLGRLARAEFKRVCFELERRRTLTSGDRLTIAVLAECFERWCTAKAELGTAYTITVTITDKKGNVITTIKPNPLVKIVETCEARILSLQNALGLTPQSRDKVRPTQPDGSADVIPGSIADTNPEWLSKIVPMRQPAAVDPREMTLDESEEESDGNDRVD
jgi:P27 family predicted phage terminase small subunit